MGRPFGTFKYKTPEDFSQSIESYFTDCTELKNMPTKGGLALHLELSKESLGDYIKREVYSDSLKRAYDLIENAWVQRLSGQSVAGVIFYLKNAFKKDWRDRYDTEHSGQVIIMNYDPAFKSSSKTKTSDIEPSQV